MADRDEPANAADDLDRIEAALDRIAANQRLVPAQPAGPADTSILAARLDGLIMRLRDALAIATS